MILQTEIEDKAQSPSIPQLWFLETISQKSKEKRWKIILQLSEFGDFTGFLKKCCLCFHQGLNLYFSEWHFKAKSFASRCQFKMASNENSL